MIKVQCYIVHENDPKTFHSWKTQILDVQSSIIHENNHITFHT
jgi:hypothetical protein